MPGEDDNTDLAPSPVIIVSGGVGASGEQMVLTVLAQFPDLTVPVITIGNVRQRREIEGAVERAARSGALLVHTLVDEQLRELLVALADEQQVEQIDLMGDLLERLSERLGVLPAGQPGLYRKLRQSYFERVDAIEYTMAHDDGRNPNGWLQADVVLAGVSRVGKTPLSLYLSVLGLRVANVPITPPVPVHPELFKLDHHKVVGLTIEAGQLLYFRRKRQARLGVSGRSDYVDPQKVLAELETAREAFERGGFHIIDVTDKPIESSADEILRYLGMGVPG